ncbi:MAG: GNAT family N-acetyltransferase [Lachnospiraceae bacterium]|nr:GNAT family N-acetyltransferase [Lachnospiraceae bacterium]
MTDDFYTEWCIGGRHRERIEKFLFKCDSSFKPALSERVDITQYAEKISRYAETVFFVHHEKDIAASSLYCNRYPAYITSVAVLPDYTGQGIGTSLIREAEQHCIQKRLKKIRLETYGTVYLFYQTLGYEIVLRSQKLVVMEKSL